MFKKICIILSLAFIFTACNTGGTIQPPIMTPSTTLTQFPLPSSSPTSGSTTAISTDTLRSTATIILSQTPVPGQTPTLKPVSERDVMAFSQNKRLGRGMNIGNALEAPKEGDWGVRLTPELFHLIKDKSFNSVRLPIRWSGHTSSSAPFTIDPAFLSRVDWAVKQCLDRNLVVVLDMHAYDEVMGDPNTEKAKFMALWTQISTHYKDYSDNVYFELLNEPTGMLATISLNDFYNEAIQIIRRTNPNRTIVLGPGGYYSISWLDYLSIDEGDRNIIISVHYYSPFHFTHQGAEWVDGSTPWLGSRWTGSQKDKDDIANDFAMAVKWANQYDRPIFLGEFGAYSKAPMDDRAKWTNEVARQAESLGWSWSYWEFCSGFGIYNLADKSWNEPLVKALIPVNP